MWSTITCKELRAIPLYVIYILKLIQAVVHLVNWYNLVFCDFNLNSNTHTRARARTKNRQRWKCRRKKDDDDLVNLWTNFFFSRGGDLEMFIDFKLLAITNQRRKETRHEIRWWRLTEKCINLHKPKKKKKNEWRWRFVNDKSEYVSNSMVYLYFYSLAESMSTETNQRVECSIKRSLWNERERNNQKKKKKMHWKQSVVCFERAEMLITWHSFSWSK